MYLDSFFKKLYLCYAMDLIVAILTIITSLIVCEEYLEKKLNGYKKILIIKPKTNSM